MNKGISDGVESKLNLKFFNIYSVSIECRSIFQLINWFNAEFEDESELVILV